MKRSMTYKAILSAGGLMILFAYQNCSKITSGLLIEDKSLAQGQTVDGMPVDPSTGDTGGAPDNPGPTTVGGGSNPNNPGGGTTNPPTPITPIETCVLRPEPNTTVAIKVGPEKVCAQKSDDRTPATTVAHAALPAVDPVSGIKYCPVVQPKPPGTVVNPTEIQDSDVAEAVAHCDQANKARVAATLNLSDYHGQYVGTVEKVGSVSNLVGSLILKAASSNSTIGSISHIRANNKFKTNRTIVLCGFEVSSISDVNGHVILVDSHVRTLSNLRGTLSLVNSIVDNMSDTENSEINTYEH